MTRCQTSDQDVERDYQLAVRLRGLGYRYGDIAVLYRSHFHSIDIQMSLARAGLPFRITSGVGVFEQIHVKDVLAYLRLVVDPGDELSFLRFVTLLPGVGEKGAAKMWERLSRRFDGSRREDRDALGALLGAKAKPLWPVLSKCFEAAYDHLAEDQVGEIVEDFCDLFYEDHLHREYEDREADDRLEDLAELAGQIAGGDGDGGRARLEGFLQDVALLTNLDDRRNDSDADKMTLSTIHQAKGMEWPVVIVPWLSAGLFPSAKAEEESRADEERRLFYVVVTRAKDELHLFSPTIRHTADGGMFPVDESVFLKEIPRDLVEYRRYSAPLPAYDRGGYGRRRDRW